MANEIKFFVVLKDIEKNREAIRTSHEYGVKGILYKNGIPDFGPVSLFEFEIDNMCQYRKTTANVIGNYEQAREKLKNLIYNDKGNVRRIGELRKLEQKVLSSKQTKEAKKKTRGERDWRGRKEHGKRKIEQKRHLRKE